MTNDVRDGLLKHEERFTGVLVPLLSGAFGPTERGFNAMNEQLKSERKAESPLWEESCR